MFVQAEYLEALNREELIKKQLDTIQPQLGEMEKELKKEKGGIEELEKMCQEQEDLLCKEQDHYEIVA